MNFSDCPFAEIKWDFGDGTVCTLNQGQNSNIDCGIFFQYFAQHEYETCGTYDVCLTITDACGCEDSYCETITVEPRVELIQIPCVESPPIETCFGCWELKGISSDTDEFNWNVQIMDIAGGFSNQYTTTTTPYLMVEDIEEGANLRICVEANDNSFEGDCPIERCIYYFDYCLKNITDGSGTERNDDFNNRIEEQDQIVTIYPNPASTELHFSHLQKEIKSAVIFSTIGTMAKSISVEEISRQSIDISILNPGTYFLVFEWMDGTKQVENFVKVE